MKSTNDAEIYYQRAIKAHPTHTSIIVKYANLLKHVKKDYDAAEIMYRRGIEANPLHADSLVSEQATV